MGLTITTLIIAYFFAFNIGASGSAAAMSVPYGSGAIKRRTVALRLCASLIMAGAVLGSGPVVKTISQSLIPEDLMSLDVVAVILLAAAGTLFMTNLLGIPLSTSEVTVGAIVGAGLSFHVLNLEVLTTIVAFWVAVPVAALVLTYLLNKGGELLRKKRRKPSRLRLKKIAFPVLIATGSLEAFAAGMNNVGNAIGPLVGAGVMSQQNGVITGGLCMALGVMLLGGKIIETGGKRIVQLSAFQGVTVSGVSGLLVMGASLLGIPIPMTQVTTSGIIGVSLAKRGTQVWQQPLIRVIGTTWVISPILSMVIAYCFVELFIRSNFYTVSMIVSAMFATWAIARLSSSLYKKQHLNVTSEENKEVL